MYLITFHQDETCCLFFDKPRKMFSIEMFPFTNTFHTWELKSLEGKFVWREKHLKFSKPFVFPVDFFPHSLSHMGKILLKKNSRIISSIHFFFKYSFLVENIFCFPDFSPLNIQICLYLIFTPHFFTHKNKYFLLKRNSLYSFTHLVSNIKRKILLIFFSHASTLYIRTILGFCNCTSIQTCCTVLKPQFDFCNIFCE